MSSARDIRRRIKSVKNILRRKSGNIKALRIASIMTNPYAKGKTSTVPPAASIFSLADFEK